jgi:hypothetical protein
MAGSTNYTFTTTYPPGTDVAVGPFLLPPNFDTADTTSPLDIYVSSVCTTNTDSSTQGIETSPSQPVFSLAFTISQVSQAKVTYAQVTVAAEGLYSTDSDKRATMLDAFNLFSHQLEILEISLGAEDTGGLIAGSTPIILNRVALSMPLMLDELLPYCYGFSAKSQYVNLSSGMSLFLEYASYQYCGPPEGPGYSLNSFVSTGGSKLSISQNADLTLSFNSFLGALSPGYSLSPASSCPVLAAGLMDLQLAGNARPFWRLVVPYLFSGSGSVDNSGSTNQYSVNLVGATTYKDLDAATQALLSGQSACGTESQGSQPVVSISFNSRVIAAPEIPILVNGQQIYIPLGTTLRAVAQRFADPGPMQFQSVNGYTDGINITLKRWHQTTVDAYAQPTSTYSQKGFTFISSGQAPALGPNGDVFDMPLFKGDAITLGSN